MLIESRFRNTRFHLKAAGSCRIGFIEDGNCMGRVANVQYIQSRGTALAQLFEGNSLFPAKYVPSVVRVIKAVPRNYSQGAAIKLADLVTVDNFCFLVNRQEVLLVAENFGSFWHDTKIENPGKKKGHRFGLRKGYLQTLLKRIFDHLKLSFSITTAAGTEY